MRFRGSILAAAVCAALPSVSSAVDFHYSGFSTAGYSEVDKDGVLYRSSTNKEAIDSSGSVEYDSILGLQGTVRFDDQWSVTAQGVVKTQPDGDFGPSLDWAYLKWQPLSNLAIRAGLTRPPTFMFSDSVYLGYANTWVRPPLEVYGISPVYQMTGVDAVWSNNVGPVKVTVQPYAGVSKLVLPLSTGGDQDIDVKDWYGLAVTGEIGSFTGRIGYHTKKYDGEMRSTQGIVNALVNAGYADVAKKVGFDGNKSPIFNVGVQYDDGSTFVISEYAKRSSERVVVAELSGAYLTVGHRFGSFAPYATYATLSVDSDRFTNLVPRTTPVGIALDNQLDGLAAGTSDQNSYAVGLRYELPAFAFLKGAVLKGQYDHIDPKDGGKGFLNAVPAGFHDSVNMYTLTADFLF
ncbi:porin [Steroidobacter flavus]|uniref:Porin n=1 Tax=Steroidobacter flavus TaxID=1842136 RepID=A0ABV8SUR1_9GAMM